ncbi:hypothetical protein K449DRAFT_439273 [Hypoxylon sp. EC38]|nr:hypothetical protein K449DRAFT_439273 [Hypoxylon sp. EC38]
MRLAYWHGKRYEAVKHCRRMDGQTEELDGPTDSQWVEHVGIPISARYSTTDLPVIEEKTTVGFLMRSIYREIGVGVRVTNPMIDALTGRAQINNLALTGPRCFHSLLGVSTQQTSSMSATKRDCTASEFTNPHLPQYCRRNNFLQRRTPSHSFHRSSPSQVLRPPATTLTSGHNEQLRIETVNSPVDDPADNLVGSDSEWETYLLKREFLQ